MTQNNVIVFPFNRANHLSIQSQEHNSATHDSTPPEDRSVSGFDISKYLPANRPAVSFVETHGVHQIPHCIYEFMIKATDRRVELLVFACLIRYSCGFHRPTCSVSARFIAKFIGLSKTSAQNGILLLLTKKLVVCLKKGKSDEDPSIYEVPIVKGYLDFLHNTKKSLTETSSTTESKSQGNLPDTQSVRSTPPPETQGVHHRSPTVYDTVHTGCTKKENSNKDLNKTLSPEKQKESNLENNQNPINAYFQSLFSKQKRFSEIKHFDSFKYFYKREDLDYVLTYLLTKGVPGTGQPVHSPMAFLSKSITNVMPLILAERDRIQKRLQREKEEAEQKQREVQEEEENEKRFVAAIGMFHKAFPTLELQQEVIQDFAKRFPLLPKDGFTLRNSAIQEWASRQPNFSTTTTSNS